ncbi:hypothetical protein [Acinetobacter sp. TAC-1]|nr:hypothetical protein [Acinetobacter sp. TAC-1]WEE41535.1 hypothetical protein PYV58_10315 [Acinetobacter sp. TAC-1]
MAYFAVYCIETGVIQNVVECPEFLKQRIHLDLGQDVLKIEGQIVQANYIVINQKLVES